MKNYLPKINLTKSVGLSSVLHVCLFAAAVAASGPSVEPLPIGVELMYGDGGTVQAPKNSTEVMPKAKAAAVVAANDHDGVAVKEKTKAEAHEPLVQEVTGKTAGSLAGTSDKGALTGREGVVNGMEVSPEERYLYEIKKLLERRKIYPNLAKRMGQTGKVTLKFTLAQDGSLVESEIIEKAESEALNQAAHALVKGIHGMKPFPREIAKSSWSITVPIEYVLN